MRYKLYSVKYLIDEKWTTYLTTGTSRTCVIRDESYALSKKLGSEPDRLDVTLIRKVDHLYIELVVDDVTRPAKQTGDRPTLRKGDAVILDVPDDMTHYGRIFRCTSDEVRVSHKTTRTAIALEGLGLVDVANVRFVDLSALRLTIAPIKEEDSNEA